MTAIANALTRLKEIEEYVLQTSNAVKGAAYTQPGLPYWTNGVVITSIVRETSDFVKLIYRVTMMCHFEKVTGGYQMGQLTKEAEAIDLLERATLYLESHRRLQTPSHLDALSEVADNGFVVQPPGVGLIRTTPEGTDYSFGVTIPLDLPLFYKQIDYS